MALNPINPAESDAVLTEAFFYIKGSTDYPDNQLISKQFGYDHTDVTQEHPIFNTTIADLYKKLHKPRVVDNLYSLVSDVDHGINPMPTYSKDKTLRTDHSKEYISSLIINYGDPSESGSPNKYSDHIDPNYDLDPKKALSDFDPTVVVDNIANYEHVFWQKMFTLIEFIKKYEDKIISDHKTDAIPTQWVKPENESSWWSNVNYASLQNELKKETIVGRYIALFIGNSAKFSANQEKYGGSDRGIDIDTSTGEVSAIPFNPIRAEMVTGSSTMPQSNIEKYEEYLWGAECLDITYIPLSASFTISEAGSGTNPRIGSFEFQVRYRYNATSYQNILLRIFLDPDDMVSASSESNYKVFTYNDTDLDNAYPSGANKLDNDYSNLLSKDENIKNNFIVSNAEMQNKIVSELTKILASGEYSDYVIFPTLRVTPTVSESGTDIVWDTLKHSTMQNFYVFYNGTEPSIAEQMSVVQDYLRVLHSDCNPTERDNEGKIVSIGHTEVEENEFLAKMYPNLFTSVNVHIIPIGANMFRNAGNGVISGGSYNPEEYYHTMTPERLYNTIRSYAQFNSFKISETGNVVLAEESGKQVYLPTEIFYLGGLNSTPDAANQGDTIAYDFPWIATCRGEQTTMPLTSRSGFGDYRQKWFNFNGDPSTPADKLQYIILKLAIDMFTEDKSSMHRYNTIAGVSMEYSENISDNPVQGYCNEVEFTINGVKFTVHSQIGKNFGSLSNPADKEA